MHALDIALETAKLDNARAIAEINTNKQITSEREANVMEVNKELHSSAHELALQKDQQAHEKDLAAQTHQQDLEQGQQEHGQALEQGDAAAQNQVAVAAAQPQEKAQ